MNTIKGCIRIAKLLAFTLSLLIFCFPTVAMAEVMTPAACTNPKPAVNNKPFKSIPINNGNFEVCQQGYLKNESAIRSVKVSLIPATATGIIDKIVITDSEGNREFGCPSNKVQEGTDLIQACGGPAILKEGDVQYYAKGHDFGYDPVKLAVKLSSDF